MSYAALDLSIPFPTAGFDSSAPYTYGLGAHLRAVSSEVVKRGPTTPEPHCCGRMEYLHGFTVRRELRRRGMLKRPPIGRRPAALRAA